MDLFTLTGVGWRPKLGSLLMALVGLSPLAVPARSEAADTCGRVYVVNADNELLRLQRSAELLARDGADERDRNRRLDIRARKTITGLADGESLIGVDFRPSNGLLYGVGRIGADPASLGQLYTIDVDSGLATAVGSRLIPLNGNAFGVDFNPVPDLLRIVSDLGQNIRVRPLDGAVAGTDTNLAYPALGDPNSVRTPRVVAVAYTNPDADLQTNTVLHDLDVDRAADVDPGLHRSRVRRCDRSRTDRLGRAGGGTLHPGRPHLRGCQVTGSARRGGSATPSPARRGVRATAPAPSSCPHSTSTAGVMVWVREYVCDSYIVQHGKRHEGLARRATTCYARCRSASPRPPSGPRSRCSSSVPLRRRCQEGRSVRRRAPYCGQAAPVAAQRRTSAWNSCWPTGGAGRAPGCQAHWTSASPVMCSTRAETVRPLFCAGSLSVRQRSASESPSQPMLRGASPQWGAPGTSPSGLLAVWWHVEHRRVGLPWSSGPRMTSMRCRCRSSPWRGKSPLG